MDITITKPGTSVDKGLDLQIKEKIFAEEAKKAKQLIDRIELPTDLKDGLSFLDMKNDTMLSYLVDFTNIVLRKAKGEKIEGHESIERICEYRLILEKSKAIDQKLKYQLNRLLTARETNERMNLEDFDIEDNNIDEESTTEEANKSMKRSAEEMESDADESEIDDEDVSNEDLVDSGSQESEEDTD